MPRHIEDLERGSGGGQSGNWPPVGWCKAVCTGATEGESKHKGTRYIELRWACDDPVYDFTDSLFLTAAALPRLAIVVARVCGRKGMELPDDDGAAIDALKDIILAEAEGKWARVQIEEKLERYTPTRGNNAGVEQTTRKKKVAYRGYETIPVPQQDEPPTQGEVVDEAQAEQQQDALPF